MSNVEISITHELHINGDKAWVKLGVSREVESGETIEDAIAATSTLVNEKIIQVIEETVDTVEKYS